MNSIMLKRPENITWTGAMACFCVSVFLVLGIALLRGQNIETIILRLCSFDMIVSIVLLSISFWISTWWRHKLVWVLVSVLPSLIWQEVGIPLIFITPLDKFSWLAALITLAMTSLFWLLETLETKYIGDSEGGEEITTLDLHDD